MRCKVHCSEKRPEGATGDGMYLAFAPVYSGSEENKEFFKYTPGGTIQFFVLNKPAADKFEVGKEYYVDFTPAGE
jgi:hypothetical protein